MIATFLYTSIVYCVLSPILFQKLLDIHYQKGWIKPFPFVMLYKSTVAQ